MRALPDFLLKARCYVFACLLTGMVCPLALGVTRYQVTPLGPGTIASGINAAGDVVGSIVVPSGRQAFLWRDGVFLQLGTLGGPNSHANAVNNRQQVAGYAETTSGETHAFLWRDGLMLDLGTLPGHKVSYARGINNLGMVVGTSQVDATSYQKRAFLYDGYSMTDLGTLVGAISSAFAINDAGQIVGEAGQAFLLSNGVMLNLTYPWMFGANGGAHAINQVGHVAVFQNVVHPADRDRPFSTDMWLYANGQLILISCPLWRCFPLGINDADQIVGSAFDRNGEAIGAFLWNPATGSSALSATGWRIESASAINNKGQIAAQACDSQGCQGVRLDPVETDTAIEYYFRDFDHYFVTADATEIAALDAGTFPGWTRTGQSFGVFELGAAGAASVCRFWSGQTFMPKSSHFYTPYASECAYLKQQGAWQYEGDVFALGLPTGPPGQGTCGTATQPLYRAYNNGMSGAPNHRYTTDPAVLDAMVAQGWVMEGEASTRVFACVPAQQ